MVKLAPRVGHPCVSAGDLDAGIRPVVAALGLARQASLFLLEFLLGAAQEARAVDIRAVREDGDVRQAKLDTDLTICPGQGLIRGGLHDEARDIPTGSVI